MHFVYYSALCKIDIDMGVATLFMRWSGTSDGVAKLHVSPGRREPNLRPPQVSVSRRAWRIRRRCRVAGEEEINSRARRRSVVAARARVSACSRRHYCVMRAAHECLASKLSTCLYGWGDHVTVTVVPVMGESVLMTCTDGDNRSPSSQWRYAAPPGIRLLNNCPPVVLASLSWNSAQDSCRRCRIAATKSPRVYSSAAGHTSDLVAASSHNYKRDCVEKLFDTELFICEVEKRPALCDMKCSNYSNRDFCRRLLSSLDNRPASHHTLAMLRFHVYKCEVVTHLNILLYILLCLDRHAGHARPLPAKFEGESSPGPTLPKAATSPGQRGGRLAANLNWCCRPSGVVGSYGLLHELSSHLLPRHIPTREEDFGTGCLPISCERESESWRRRNVCDSASAADGEVSDEECVTVYGSAPDASDRTFWAGNTEATTFRSPFIPPDGRALWSSDKDDLQGRARSPERDHMSPQGAPSLLVTFRRRSNFKVKFSSTPSLYFPSTPEEPRPTPQDPTGRLLHGVAGRVDADPLACVLKLLIAAAGFYYSNRSWTATPAYNAVVGRAAALSVVYTFVAAVKSGSTRSPISCACLGLTTAGCGMSPNIWGLRTGEWITNCWLVNGVPTYCWRVRLDFVVYAAVDLLLRGFDELREGKIHERECTCLRT
ncbi:hypothetical protein PR048_003143 [Dryococelus australis]|uniref:Uncharacterized protein n=1 Tax=Dryococelus australis TaxID=614101 RepID=A0ABQ9IM79_9NEOP|nr:hypothetical protein PR048_003143 [Dryococelus australis]